MHRIARDQHNEYFIAYLDAGGTPVQLPFREMSPDEVAFAMRWHIGKVEAEITLFSALLQGDGTSDAEIELTELDRMIAVCNKALRLFSAFEARTSGRNRGKLLKMRLHRLSLN